MTNTQGMDVDSVTSQPKLYRSALVLWSCTACAAIFIPWPYALAGVLFTTFLHFAALDGAPPVDSARS